MKVTVVRMMFVSAVLLLLGVQAYAHHGNEFLNTAGEMSSAEVQLGEMAQDKSQNAHVKSFAEMMVKIHTETFDRIQELLMARSKAGIGQAGPTKQATNMQLNRDHMKAMDHLKTLSGAQFDREFMNAMVRDHRAAISAFEAASRAHGANQQTSTNQGSTSAANQANPKTANDTARQKPQGTGQWSQADYARDLDTAEFASETLPTLRQHLQEAQNIQKELGGTTNTQPQK